MKSKLFFCLCSLLLASAVLSAKTKLVIFNDVHVSPGFHTEEQLKRGIAEIASINPDAVIFNGDLTNEGSDVELKNIKEIVSVIDYPLFMLPGNHENTWSQSAGATYVNIFGTDRFSGVVGEDSIIIIGTNCGPYMKMGDGHVKQEDLHWMSATIDSLLEAHPTGNILSFNHYALNPDLDNYFDYISRLKKYPVLAHVNGHYHRYMLDKVEGGNDLHNITLTSLDRGKGNYGYSIIEIEGDSIKVFSKLLGAEPELIYVIKKPEKTRFKHPGNNWDIKTVWNDSASIFTRPTVYDSNIVFGTSNGYIRSVNLKDSLLEWQYFGGAPYYSMPVSVKEEIIVPTINEGILKFDKQGKVIAHFADSLPYVADGIYDVNRNILYQGGYGKLVAINPETLREIWIFDSISNYCQGQPAIDGEEIIFGAWDSYLRSVNVNNGELNWKWNNGKSSNILGPGNVVPVVTPTRVLIVAPDRYMTMIDRATGETIWRDNSVKYRESLAANPEKTLAYAKTMDGQLIAVDLTSDSFNPVWTTDLNIGYEHAPCPSLVVDDMVYVGSRRGIVSIVDAKTGELLANIPLGVSEVNGFAAVPALKTAAGFTPVAVSLIEGTVTLLTPEK